MVQLDLIKKFDPEVGDAMQLEMDRQESHLEMIASENFVSQTSMQRVIPESVITAVVSASIS